MSKKRAKVDPSFSSAHASSAENIKEIAGLITQVWQDLLEIKNSVNAMAFDSVFEKRVDKEMTNVQTILAQINQGVLNVKAITLMASSIRDLMHFVIEQKRTNPLISDALVVAITRADHNANQAMELASKG
jgi:hypothetical protein